jgi:hypothetical protein
MVEWSKALDCKSNEFISAWVQIPLLPCCFWESSLIGKTKVFKIFVIGSSPVSLVRIVVNVAQSVKAVLCDGIDWGFESPHSPAGGVE